MTNGVGALDRGVLGRHLSRVRARVHGRELDAALADGQDPWSSSELMVRASWLCSLPERRKLATALAGLVVFAEQRRPPPPSASPYFRVRYDVVLEQRDALLVLAERLREPAPVEVAVVAQLALLVWDESSPVYADGKHPAGVGEVAAQCLHALGDLLPESD